MSSQKFTKINGAVIVLSDTRPATAIRKLAAGQAWQVSDDAGLNPADLVDLKAVAGELQTLRAGVAGQFIDRDEMIQAILTAMAAGEHVFIYSPPGAAKTKVVETLAAGINGDFAERQITAESTGDEIFGPVDAIAFSQGTFTRRWAGIAAAEIFYINEVWEASSTVTNILKTALESRVVHDGDVIRKIPLLTAIADSNHVPTDKSQQADWDRFLIRLSVDYLKDPDFFEAMLTVEAGGKLVNSLATADDLRLMAAAAELIAMNPPQDMVDTIKDLWREIGQNGRSVSDRRWRKTLKAACAFALLNGESPAARHMAVARWTLWNDLDERDDIANLVMSKCDPLAGAVLDAEALLADLKKAAINLPADDLIARQDVMAKGRKLGKNAEGLLGQPGSGAYLNRLQSVKGQADGIVNKVLDSLLG